MYSIVLFKLVELESLKFLWNDIVLLQNDTQPLNSSNSSVLQSLGMLMCGRSNIFGFDPQNNKLFSGDSGSSGLSVGCTLQSSENEQGPKTVDDSRS